MEISYSRPVGIMSCLKHIIQTEGMGALFKGLGPTLVGVAPSRAFYFTVYAKAKHTLNKSGVVLPESKFVHTGSACSAGMLYPNMFTSYLRAPYSSSPVVQGMDSNINWIRHNKVYEHELNKINCPDPLDNG